MAGDSGGVEAAAPEGGPMISVGQVRLASGR